MTTLKTAVVGDIDDYRIVTLDGVTNLDSVTAVEAHVWSTSVDSVTLSASVVDATARTIRVELGDAAGWLATVATSGSWFIEYQVTFGTTVLTWPGGAPDRLPVQSEGD